MEQQSEDSEKKTKAVFFFQKNIFESMVVTNQDEQQQCRKRMYIIDTVDIEQNIDSFLCKIGFNKLLQNPKLTSKTYLVNWVPERLQLGSKHNIERTMVDEILMDELQAYW